MDATYPIATNFDRRVIDDLLRQLEVRRYSQNWHDYNRCVQVVRTWPLSPASYEQAVTLLAEWIGV